MNQQTELQKIGDLDAIADKALQELSAAQGSFSKAFAVSTAMNDLRNALTPHMAQFMKLQGTSLGFKTDKDETGGYPIEVVKDALIEATLRGVQPVGNQFNVISKRCYITKEGYEYKLKHLRGLAGLKINIGVPKVHTSGEGAIVECKAEWTYNGVADTKTSEIPVRVNKAMGVDAIIGKASRKMAKRVFEQITGSPEPEDEGVDDPKALPAPTNGKLLPEPTQTELVTEVANVAR
jgi:hypothetical protein